MNVRFLSILVLVGGMFQVNCGPEEGSSSITVFEPPMIMVRNAANGVAGGYFQGTDSVVPGHIVVHRFEGMGTLVSLQVSELLPSTTYQGKLMTTSCANRENAEAYLVHPEASKSNIGNVMMFDVATNNQGEALTTASASHLVRGEARSVALFLNDGALPVACADLFFDEATQLDLSSPLEILPTASLEDMNLSGNVSYSLAGGNGSISVTLDGFQQEASYGVVVHSLPCGLDGGGGPYLAVEAMGDVESNKLFGTLNAMGEGRLFGQVLFQEALREDAQSVVVNKQIAGVVQAVGCANLLRSEYGGHIWSGTKTAGDVKIDAELTRTPGAGTQLDVAVQGAPGNTDWSLLLGDRPCAIRNGGKVFEEGELGTLGGGVAGIEFNFQVTDAGAFSGTKSVQTVLRADAQSVLLLDSLDQRVACVDLLPGEGYDAELVPALPEIPEVQDNNPGDVAEETADEVTPAAEADENSEVEEVAETEVEENAGESPVADVATLELCEGWVELTELPVAVQGTTDGGAQSWTCNGTEQGRELGYALLAPAAGVLRVTMTPYTASGPQALYTVSGCDQSEQPACVLEGTVNGVGQELFVEVTEGESVYLVVDSLSVDNDGPFQLNLDWCTPGCADQECGTDGCGGSCGDCEAGFLCGEEGLCLEDQTIGEGTEDVCAPQCDDNVCGDDGCGGSCGACGTAEVCETGTCVDAVEGCPGTIAIDSLPFVYQGNTLGGEDNWKTTNSCGFVNGGQGAPDHLFVYEAEETVTLLLSLTGSEYGTPTVLYTMDDCAGEVATCIEVSQDLFGGGEFEITVEAGTQLFVVADGLYAGDQGAYTLAVALAGDCVPSCTLQQCGNDGCGGSCGACSDNEVCSEVGVCMSADGACLAPEDANLLNQANLVNTVSGCGKAVFMDSKDCVAQDTGLSSGCATCLHDYYVTCATDNCFWSCVTVTSQDCMMCLSDTQCYGAFESCAGFPPNVLPQ